MLQVLDTTTEPGAEPLRKNRTGIPGFDDITNGGLADGRLTAIIGGPGTGKSLFALQYLLTRATETDEPGLFVTFEESIDRVRSNMSGFNWDLKAILQKKVAFVDARIPREAVRAGAFDFAGLLAILAAQKVEMGVRHVVFDGIDLLMSGLNDDYLERQELVRLDEWIRTEEVSGLLTVKAFGPSERDQRRIDLIQYITDSAILLESKLYETSAARTLRVVKYRGTGFVADAIPMVIGSAGIALVPSQISRESYPVFSERLSSGVPRLDSILEGGYIRGSSVLVTGAPGTAKTSLACSLTSAACEANLKAVFISFDESDAQIIANMNSIGIELARHVASGRLIMASLRSKGHNPEECFLRIMELISRNTPDVLVVDPLSAFVGTPYPFASAMGETMIDMTRSRGITFYGTSLLGNVNGETESSESQVSTIADTWIHLSYLVHNGERNRALTIIKSRGTGHSNQVRELAISNKGIDLKDIYAGEGSVLLGSARLEKLEDEAREERRMEIAHRQRQFELDRAIAALKAQAQAVNMDLQSKLREAELEDAAEAVRIESRKSATAQRLLMRRKIDDMPTRVQSAQQRTGETT